MVVLINYGKGNAKSRNQQKIIPLFNHCFICLLSETVCNSLIEFLVSFKMIHIRVHNQWI